LELNLGSNLLYTFGARPLRELRAGSRGGSLGSDEPPHPSETEMLRQKILLWRS